MEENIISMFMDVKLDIRERKLEFSHLKSWTRYFVRVEAVKCFPCYIKISFFKSQTDESTDLIVRINIPGLTVQMATSRTRAHSYGLFWKNNRKRCCAYFALPCQLLCERHLRWMKKSIRNLELYRQEILQLRRASRTPMHEIRQDMKPEPVANELGIYQNLDFTQNMADVRDILGPLPNVPDQSGFLSEHSRRISTASGIYEEIFDRGSPMLTTSGPRMSVASGIYEEMKLPDIKEGIERNFENQTDGQDEAPPLPPRPRSHTNEFELQRSFTNPESDLLKKKKHWQLFESVFGRRRTNSGSSSLPGGSTNDTKSPPKKHLTGKEPKVREKVIYRDKVRQLRLVENKRNSFSSPDLSVLRLEEGTGSAGDNISDEGSCSSEFYIQRGTNYTEDCFTSSEFLNVSHCSSIEESLANLLLTAENDESKWGQAMNVSEQILPNFNISHNTSTVNLVGPSCKMIRPAAALPSVPSNPGGYCEMGAPGTGFNKAKIEGTEIRNKSDVVEEYVPKEDSIYMNMNGKEFVKDETSRSSSTSSGVSSIYSNRSSVSSNNNGKQRNSVDDKIPSYYPNEDFRTPKKPDTNVPVQVNTKERSGKKSSQKRTENHYVSSPRRKGTPQHITTLPRLSKSAQKPSASKTKTSARSISSERRDSSSHTVVAVTVSDASPAKNSENDPPIPTFYQKYATIARSISPSTGKYLEKNSAKKGEQPALGGSKRFGSLPRFAKIDLSPLRLKINSVLQRHNPENN
ncbi:uncharacterized protein LOC129754867 [Uranotaenia lowii]|uniref:uncharacterized protein LOC129754867 n=1 Tax=Uranotaenia lowii TaxID=190385 RepID=UPI0024795905|nr:uncharacterized protein LOC129754867 [Uranotaenia lowii]XP_055607082.1 uncharacterized protein LOC129754867 [Uranotaenia lowii]XP_055607083.1 uncharacterized protein LOC129754867 [Uranotaenia lowii]